jgi:hypothetical protein
MRRVVRGRHRTILVLLALASVGLFSALAPAKEITASLAGGVFEATAGRSGPELSTVAGRIIRIVLNAPGLGAELVHGAAGR